MTVCGTYMSMPPTELTSRGKPWKLTTMTWLMGMPVYSLSVLSASDGPPYHIACVIFCGPYPSTFTSVSRGIESWLIVCDFASKCISMMVSECAGRPASSRPNSATVVPLRQSQPSSAASWARVFPSTRLLALSTARSNFWYPGHARTVATTPAMTSRAKTPTGTYHQRKRRRRRGPAPAPLLFFVPVARPSAGAGPYVWYALSDWRG